MPAAAQNVGSRPHSRTARWRAVSLSLLTILMVGHFIQWRYTGSTVSPIEPSETMYTLQNGAVNAGFIFFSLAILATLIFGRFVCGWGCHIVALQDLCAWLMNKIGIKPKVFRSRLLVYVPLLAALYMFVWPTVSRIVAAPAGAPLFPNFTNHLIVTDYWATFPTLFVAIPFLLICGFATVYFLGSKGFCTYACPYGGFFGVADKFSPGRIRVTDDCNQCGQCTAVCTSNVLVHAEVEKFKMVVDPGCMKCMDCVSVCPNDALYFGFGKPPIGITTSSVKRYSLSWKEEIAAAAAFLAALFAVWDAYQLVPMLMALGIAAVISFITLKTIQLLSSSDVSFLRYLLKSSGEMRHAGWTFLSLSILALAITAHTGWIHYYESAGARAYAQIRIPDELALARNDPARWLSSSEKQIIADGSRQYNVAFKYGLFTNVDALPKLAWLEYLSGNADRSAALLERSAAAQSGPSRALSLYYRGAILNRLGKYRDALSSLDLAINESPDLAAAREERGEALWQMGKRDEAVAEWISLTAEHDALIAQYMLAGSSQVLGDDAGSMRYLEKARSATPDDALFNWTIGMRLQNLGMKKLAENSFQRAVEIDPAFRRALEFDLINGR